MARFHPPDNKLKKQKRGISDQRKKTIIWMITEKKKIRENTEEPKSRREIPP